MPSISEILAQARRRLAAASFQPSTREANLLLASILDWTEAQVLARQDRTLTTGENERFRLALDRRLSGEPIAYILGVKEFYGRPFRVDNRVLIPRPETEHLIETALELPLSATPTLLDLGTGSGCLACTLALEKPTSRVVATDISSAALGVARANRQQHSLSNRLYLVCADLARGIDLSAIDLVVSNPPYVAREQATALSPEILDFEPETALFADSDGLEVIRRLLSELAGLRSGVWLILEMGSKQDQQIKQLVSESCFSLLAIKPDYARLPRVALLQRQ